MMPPSPEPRPVVESGDGRRRLSAGLIGLVILGVTLGAVGHVAVHAKRIETALALGLEQRKLQELTLERRQLEIEIGMLKDPSRVIATARERLGMSPPRPEAIHALAAKGEAGRR
jgi:cell division protein FtsL